ncbi:cytochrome c biogenesis protein CcsA [Thermoactinomyces intermedius]|jgi:ABC-type transport system involved in cytochrome c biogenesis permease subunit|uniref:Cytochrome c biogenesis protein CcsA n=1 Tax=Thermoactinomyces intermedius TaxID=2024 RepID=A0A8I1DET8_THEIN|nr:MULTISPECIES: cytochrome c biogenesis protein CcsA [Thermoactinomyces]MBA4548927.1 cytochrome c biogenesis protein CcsA [Thermoactinomyces intermedius]MBA4835597.1 cytochrome c biogenesis protein CcsA [Thermoactinomyces intermedius]MBH8595334.1 cytochrome c biogenesis protein CcsA [Thermoactinomyces intermedius]MBH8601247.1 cytochrome c biogenesis protein CcsA [Thermoactinomyces sp. CICC 23799]
MEQLMENLLFGTFFLYLISSVAFVMGISKDKNEKNEQRKRRWGNIAVGLAIVGAVFQTLFIITRMLIGGHFPTSNMFEFTAFLCYAIVIAFVIVYFIYKNVVLGAFVMPLAVILLAYASVFPRDVQPLIPALQSYWLPIHVSTAALGQGAFGIGFVAGLIYLIKTVGNQKSGKNAFWLETTLLIVLMFLGFSIVQFAFGLVDYEAKFSHTVDGEANVQEYSLPPIVSPTDSQIIQMDSFPGLNEPLFESPGWMKGEKAASKLNSVIWSVITGLILYGLLRLILRKPLRTVLHPLLKDLDSELVDEISYRAIAIGFPIFTLGALIFAMIWAHQAWGRFWGWDPKEVWALITWLFYSAYLHLRLSRGWHGLKSAWLAVGGFVIIMINLIAINLVITGLHSYA